MFILFSVGLSYRITSLRPLFFRSMLYMKNLLVSPFIKYISITSISLVMAGCASSINNSYAPSDEKNGQLIEVVRDNQKNKLPTEKGTEDCPTSFYINDKKVGSYAVNDSNSYQLEPGNYNLKVANCQGQCSKYGTDVTIVEGQSPKFILSSDAAGQPFIIVNSINNKK